MTLEQSIRALAEEGTVSALEQHLPSLLSRFTMPADPDERLTVSEAAAFLKMPVKTLELRVRDNAIVSFKDGTRRFILRRDAIAYNERLRAQELFQRDQAARASAPAGVEPDVLDLLHPSDSGKSTAKKKARRS